MEYFQWTHTDQAQIVQGCCSRFKCTFGSLSLWRGDLWLYPDFRLWGKSVPSTPCHAKVKCMCHWLGLSGAPD